MRSSKVRPSSVERSPAPSPVLPGSDDAVLLFSHTFSGRATGPCNPVRLAHVARATHRPLVPRAEMEWVNRSSSDVISFGICFKLTIAARNTNATDDGAALSAQQYNNRVSGGCELTNIGFFLQRWGHARYPPAPQLPPACAVLPTATLGKLIRWRADILSIFLSWLRVRLVGCLLIEWGFFFSYREQAVANLVGGGEGSLMQGSSLESGLKLYQGEGRC